ncbi:Major Facilitator Superfamily protein [Virgibacillus subterraneus]|uniref:Major Facilitator Superfamily protein n=1 Tax=Virgibacillus subterraneus TaxID=621109 RepID=A0A1H9I882_9BACI|nr:MFS transporter [Virgibacillus subterraneus]SEQ70759.1 Major Facilitator Superfamily protein [Virgibacillus subterraneus]
MDSVKQLEREAMIPLSKSKSFILLWFTTVISSLSLSMFMFIQSWYVVESLGMEASLGIILVCLTTMRMVSMVIGGVVADKSRQTKIMCFSDISLALLVISLAGLFTLFSEVPIWVLAVNATFFGACGGLFEPSRDALLPKVVKIDQLTRANSLLQGAIQIALFTGPLLAGILINFFGYSIVLILIGLCLCLSGIGVLFIKVSNDNLNKQEKVNQPFQVQLMEGFSYTWNSPLLRALFIITIIVNFFISGPLMMGLPIFVEGVLNGSSVDFSFVQGGFTFGMILGSILIGLINIQRKRGAYALYLIALQGSGMLIFSQVNSIFAAVGIIILIGMLNPGVNIPLISLVQSHSDQAKVGRVMSLIRTGSLGLIPLSYAVTSVFLGFGVQIQILMAWSSLPLILSVVILYFVYPILRSAD